MDMRDHDVPVFVLKGFHELFTLVLEEFGVKNPLFNGSKLFINFEFLLAFI